MDRNSLVAWAAGFFDGEGYVGITRHTTDGFALQVAVTQVDPRPLGVLRGLFGGSISGVKNRAIYQWRLSARAAAPMLKEILPFLRVKGEQAALGLEFQARRVNGRPRGLPRNAPVNDREKDERDYMQMRSLKLTSKTTPLVPSKQEGNK